MQREAKTVICHHKELNLWHRIGNNLLPAIALGTVIFAILLGWLIYQQNQIVRLETALVDTQSQIAKMEWELEVLSNTDPLPTWVYTMNRKFDDRRFLHLEQSVEELRADQSVNNRMSVRDAENYAYELTQMTERKMQDLLWYVNNGYAKVAWPGNSAELVLEGGKYANADFLGAPLPIRGWWGEKRFQIPAWQVNPGDLVHFSTSIEGLVNYQICKAYMPLETKEIQCAAPRALRFEDEYMVLTPATWESAETLEELWMFQGNGAYLPKQTFGGSWVMRDIWGRTIHIVASSNTSTTTVFQTVVNGSTHSISVTRGALVYFDFDVIDTDETVYGMHYPYSPSTNQFVEGYAGTVRNPATRVHVRWGLDGTISLPELDWAEWTDSEPILRNYQLPNGEKFFWAEDNHPRAEILR